MSFKAFIFEISIILKIFERVTKLKSFKFVSFCDFCSIQLLAFKLEFRIFKQSKLNIFLLAIKTYENWFPQIYFVDVFTLLFSMSFLIIS